MDHEHLHSEEDRRIERLVRAGSGPCPDAGAAKRIADAAWEAAGPPAQPRRRVGGGSLPGFRRWMVPAAAAVLVAVGLVAWRGTDSAFAVEGDPVRVLEDGEWRTTRRVKQGDFVHVPAGAATVLAGRDGARIEPESGALLRLSMGGQEWTVDVFRGAVEAAGTRVVLRTGDVEAHPDTDNRRVQVRLSVGAGTFDAPTLPAEFAAAVQARPLFEVRSGHVRLCGGIDGSELRLGPSEAAAGVPAARGLALAMVHDWEGRHLTEVVQQIVRGGELLGGDLRSSDGVLLQLGNARGGVAAFRVPFGRVAEADLGLSLGRALRLQMDRSEIEVRVETTIGQAPRVDERHVGVYAWELDGERTEVELSSLGPVRVTDADGERWYPSLELLREERPDVTRRFGEFLPTSSSR